MTNGLPNLDGINIQELLSNPGKLVSMVFDDGAEELLRFLAECEQRDIEITNELHEKYGDGDADLPVPDVDDRTQQLRDGLESLVGSKFVQFYGYQWALSYYRRTEPENRPSDWRHKAKKLSRYAGMDKGEWNDRKREIHESWQDRGLPKHIISDSRGEVVSFHFASLYHIDANTIANELVDIDGDDEAELMERFIGGDTEAPYVFVGLKTGEAAKESLL